MMVGPSVTRFGPFDKNFKVFGNLFKVFVKILNLPWQINYAIGQIFLLVRGQMW